nr:ABC transporter substrate-binding protein [Chloroflexota bacterium]
HLESVEVVDPLTVRFGVRPPAVAFLADALAQAPILPSGALADALAAFYARLSTVRPAELRAAGQALTDTHGECDTTLWWPVVVERFGCEPPVETVAVAERCHAAGLLPSEPLDLYETQTSVLGGLLHEYRRVAVAQGPERMARALQFLPLAREPIGSGPYRFMGRTDPDTVELVAHDDHWGGLAITPTVTIRWFGWPANEDALLAAIRDGELDWVPDGAERWGGPVEPLAWIDSPGLGVSYLALDTAPGSIFSDPNVRLALDRCVDRADIVERATEGAGRIVRSPIHPSSWAFAEPRAPATGPDEARRLLEEAGWRMVDGTYELDGRRLEADLGARPGTPDRIEFATLLRDAARPCGFDLSVREADITPPVGSDARLIWRLYDGYLTGWGSLADPDHAYDAFHQSADPRQEVTARSAPWNIMRWQDPVASDALDAGRATHDPAVRLEAYRTFQERLEAEMPVIWGWADGLNAVISPGVTLDGAPLDLSHPRYHAEIERWRLVGP